MSTITAALGSDNMLSALVGALLGGVLSAVIAIAIERRRTKKDRQWLYVTKVSPVLGLLLSEDAPSYFSYARNAADFQSRLEAMFRESALLGIARSSREVPIREPITAFLPHLEAYCRKAISKEEFEARRRETIAKVDAILAKYRE
ncbi:MAG: hypothetical protein ACT4N2_12790 [Hyphomicrobium sp.]